MPSAIFETMPKKNLSFLSDSKHRNAFSNALTTLPWTKACDELDQIKGLEFHHPYYASFGAIYFGLENKPDSKKFFEKGMKLTSSRYEQQLLINKISSC